MLTTWRFKMLLITEIHKRTKSLIYFKNDICAISTISAGRTTISDIFFSSEGDHSVSTVAAFNVNFYVIDKHYFFLLSPLVSMRPSISYILQTALIHVQFIEYDD